MSFNIRSDSYRNQYDSLIIEDSEDEDGLPTHLTNTFAKSTVIDDSSSSVNSSINNTNSNNDPDKKDNESTDSEYVEDMQFVNNSLKISILECSSDSESDENVPTQITLNKLKRQSIYDNPSTASTPNKSTPIYSHFKKRVKRTIIETDSDSNDSDQENFNKESVIKHENENVREQEIFAESPQSKKNDESNESSYTISDSSKSSETSDSEYEPKKSTKSKVPVKKANITEKMNSSNEIVISSATNTSESEYDKDVVQLAKQQIGVGNIDPITAQKKELLILSINHTQSQIDKLNKFVHSVDIEKLPDKGKKVQDTIKQNEIKIASLKADLAKISQTKSSIQNSFNSPIQSGLIKKNIMQEPIISPLDEDKENFDIKKRFEYSIKKKLSISNISASPSRFDDFDVKDIPESPKIESLPTSKKALETLNKQKTVTQKKLEQLHGSLTSRPNDDQRAEDPSGLNVPLMHHQQHALAWMKWREVQKPKGGILADDMGLGKTLTMISLVLASLNDKQNGSSSNESDGSSNEWLSRNKHKRYYGGTLVVCPASLIKQWEAEVKNRCKRGLLSVLVFHGNNRTIDERKLSKYNMVVTTYQILVREADLESRFYSMEWDRVILDEAHYVRNHKSKACQAVCGLNAKRRWALTGTPIQNKESDLYSILKFLRCSPFNDLQVWKRWVDNKSEAGKQRLITIMKTLMLRRTKQELQAKGTIDSLPDKSLDIIEVEMDRDEKLVYQKILLFSQNLFAQFLAQRAEKQHTRELYGGKFDRPSYSIGSNTQFTKAQKVLLAHHSNIIKSHEILVLLLRLRQMCCHPALLHSMLEKIDVEANGIDEGEINSDLINKLQNMSMHEEEGIEEHVANFKIDSKVADNLLTETNPVFDKERRGSKVRAVLKTIKEIVRREEKLIVVSQWTSFLHVIAKNLENIQDAKYQMFTGEVAVKHRQEIIENFNDEDSDINILLLSLTAGGVGLNLVGANHLLLIDIHWNPQLEAQAQDRIYRFGQKKDVYIYKFICKDSIEERVKNLQDKKLELANHVLTGTRSVSSKLTIEDLKLLFS